jgi:Amt family ammonium transporter
MFADTGTEDTSRVLEEHGRKIDLIKTNLDYTWVLLSAMLVFFMQAGFMALEAGMARSKNSINVAIKNLTDFVIGVIGFWLLGFGLMFGKSLNGIVGFSDFMISINNPWTAAFFMFQAVFVGTAATIDSGAVCERAKLKQYVLLSLLVSVVIYPVFGHWVWGSFLHGTDPSSGGAGWLELRGFKDFAGSSVVHSVGGWMALAGVLVIGPRIGKFIKDPVTGKITGINKIQPGDMRFVFLGTFILFFGWFGFNSGSTLSATPQIATIALNTILAASFGCLAASVLSWLFHPEKKIEGDMIANGILAGLVGITAGCAYVGTFGSMVIGLVSGVVVFAGSHFLEKVLKLDDVVGAIPVHAFAGAWGTLAVGFFILPEHLGEITRMQQIGIQALGVLACFGWAFGMGLLFYILVHKLLGGVRVTPEEEIMGLNVAEHGARSSILELANTMDQLTRSGDFSTDSRVDVEHGTEIGDLALIFNRMIDRVKEAMSEIHRQKTRAEAMLHESEQKQHELTIAREELERERQEAALKRTEYLSETSEKISQVTVSIDNVKDKLLETSQTTGEMSSSFNKMVEYLDQMLQSMDQAHGELRAMENISSETSTSTSESRLTLDDLARVTREIEEMISFINEIAEKTHVIAINTSIEAARAGESGKGFVVISKTVRELSQQTVKTASEIQDKITSIDNKIGSVTGAISRVLSIVDEINQMNHKIIEIVSNNRDISKSLQHESTFTINAVEHVTNDIERVVKEAERLSSIGNGVAEDLKNIK